MDEMISRSAAIEAIEKHIRTAEEPYQLTYADKVMNHAFEIAASCVYNLSATEPKIIRCKDCKHNQLPSTSGNAICEIFYGMTDREGFGHMAERRTNE